MAKPEARVKLESQKDGSWYWSVSLKASDAPNGKGYFYEGTVIDQVDAQRCVDGAIDNIRAELAAPTVQEYTVEL